MLLAAPAIAGDLAPWPEFIALIDDSGTAKIESRFSVDRIMDCPDSPNPADLTAFQAGPGTMTIYVDPEVGPTLVVRYGERSFTERAWPELAPALIVIAYITADDGRFDGGFASGFEDCRTWVRP
jgi:hypothetical protein